MTMFHLSLWAKNLQSKTADLNLCEEGATSVGAGMISPKASLNHKSTRCNLENPAAASQDSLGKTKHWQQVQCELPKEILNFCDDIIYNILTHDQLLDFAVNVTFQIVGWRGQRKTTPKIWR